MIDRVVRSHEHARRLAVEVCARPAYALMRPGEQVNCLLAAAAPRLAARDPPLCTPQVALRHPEDAWVGDGLPIGQRGERFQTEIDPGLLACKRPGLQWHRGTREGGVPAIRFPANRHRLWRARDGVGPPHRDTPDLGQDQDAVVERGTVTELLVGERVVAVCAVEARIARRPARLDATEEGLKGTVQTGQHSCKTCEWMSR